MHFVFLRAAAAAVAAVLCLASAADAAPGGVRIIVQQWSPAAPATQTNEIVLDHPGLLGDALAQGWAQARAPVCAALKAELGKPNLIADGFSLYNMDCAMAKTGTLTVTGVTRSIVTLTFALPGNMFKATSTQPSVAGSYADPCTFFSYDLAATTTLHLDTLAVDAFSVAIRNPSRPDSCNAAGDVAKFVASTLRFFGGADFLAIAQNAMTRTQNISTAPLNAALASFTGPLRTYGARYAVEETWVRHGDLFFAFAPAYTPQPLTAGIGGTISMMKSAWSLPAPNCAIFSIAGNVQTGPAPIVDPETLAVGTAPTRVLGTVASSGTAADAGDRFVCAYTDGGLPAGVPIAFHASAASPAAYGRVSYPVGIRTDGWTGVATLSGISRGQNFVASVSPQVGVVAQRERPGAYVNPGDPAANAASRFDPAAKQSITLNRTDRVALNPQPLPPKTRDTFSARGIALFTNGDFAGAAEAFTRAVGANPSDAVALHNLGLAHARLGQTTLATTELQRAAAMARAAGDLGTSKASENAIIIVSGRH